MTRTEAYLIRQKLENAVQAIAKNSPKIYDAFILFPDWKSGVAYDAGVKLRYKNRLYVTVSARTSQSDWTPDIVPALYEVIPSPNEDGTQNNPIAYTVGMKLFDGLYYTEYGVLYVCTRDSGNPLFNPLSELVGLYVEVVE